MMPLIATDVRHPLTLEESGSSYLSPEICYPAGAMTGTVGYFTLYCGPFRVRREGRVSLVRQLLGGP